MLDASTLVASMPVIVMLPFTDSAVISPLELLMRIFSFTELTFTLPRAPSTSTSPSTDFAVIEPVPPLMITSPRTVFANTSACTPSIVTKL